MASATHNIVFYTYPLAFHPAKVAVLLSEKKLPHKKVNVDILGGGSLQPWYAKICPQMYAPAVQIDGKAVLESRVICDTLDKLDGKPLGGDQVDRAVVEQLVQHIDTFDGNLFAYGRSPAGMKKLLASLDDYRKKVAAAMAKRNPELKEVYEAKIATMGKLLEASNDKAKVEECENILKGILDAAEQRLSTAPAADGADGPFLAGPAYTVADAMFAPILFRVWNLGAYQDFIAPRPALVAYNKRVRARPSWQAGFGEASSAWGKLAVLPVLVKVKFSTLLGWY